jgi:cysteine/O-acetylserine efflux protein
MFQAIYGFSIYVIINAFTPGPGNLLALNASASYGLSKSRSLLLGIFSGYYVVQIICAFCVFGMNAYIAPAMAVMKYLGAVYIAWLAFHIFKSTPEGLVSAKKSSYLTGFMLQFVNVKIYLFGITALTGYVTPYCDSFPILFLAELIIATVGSVATLSWALAGNVFQKIYLRHYFGINLVLALLLVQCAVSLLLSE